MENTNNHPTENPNHPESLHPEGLEDNTSVLPILSLRNIVLFPGIILPISVGREKSLRLIDDIYAQDKAIGVLAQKDAQTQDPNAQDLFKVGVMAKIIKKLAMPDGSVTIIVQGKTKFQVMDFTQEDPFFIAKVKYLHEDPSPSLTLEEETLLEEIRDLANKIMKESHKIGLETDFALRHIDNPHFLINFLCTNIQSDLLDKQQLLELTSFRSRAEKLISLLSKELNVISIKSEIQTKLKQELEKQQREYVLHQQIKTIQEELGEGSGDKEIKQLKEKMATKKWSAKVAEYVKSELDRLTRLNPQMSEYSVQLNYCELLLELPWEHHSKDNYDLQRAQKILDQDHYGLKKIKERIIEHLAVLKLKKNMKAPILCFYGPPGVGKTSLGKSIAKALSREYVRLALGGMRDEAEIRGHRKTYVGAMPGRVITAIKKAKTSNPVIVLDEIDKIGSGAQGDPSSALLELLDPEQNNTFTDNYLEIEYDLSHVLFVATANNLNTIHPALLDRMELIEVNGYAIEEKRHIALEHLIPQSLEEHGMKAKDFELTPEGLEKVIAEYTRESGVRSLKQKIDKLVRNQAKQVVQKVTFEKQISLDEIEKILGIPRSQDQFISNKYAGVVTGLAWTAAGGDVLFIESSLVQGQGKLNLTGNLGDVMKESAVLALQYLKAHSTLLQIDPRVFEQYDVHIHFPEGATPKDGPSAGITILTALASLFTQRKVREKLAMTGEITLRGKVLPVGGIKEKVLAAKRAGILDLILCEENRKDVAEIEPTFIEGLKFHYVEQMEEVLKIALLNEKVPAAIEVIYREKEIKKQ